MTTAPTWLWLFLAVAALAGAFGVRHLERRLVAERERYAAEMARIFDLRKQVQLPCFGGPRDGETITCNASCEQLRVPFLEAEKLATTWSPEADSVQPRRFLRQALYRRLWIGEQEQLVYQGTVDG